MSTMLSEQTIQQFLDGLASSAPTPGGGSVAALQGALAAGLIGMVAAGTLNRKGFEGYTPHLSMMHQAAAEWRNRLVRGISEDATAFQGVMAAYRLPKTSEPEKSVRQEAIQTALQVAASVPLVNARACAALVPMALELMEIGNPNMVTDAAVAASAAIAGSKGALLNVLINLESMQDQDWKRQIDGEIRELESMLAVEEENLQAITHRHPALKQK